MRDSANEHGSFWRFQPLSRYRLSSLNCRGMKVVRTQAAADSPTLCVQLKIHCIAKQPQNFHLMLVASNAEQYEVPALGAVVRHM